METLLIHPENNEQLAAVKAVLKALKIQFEVNTPSSELPAHIKQLANKSIKQYEENGNAISLAEFSEQYFVKK